MPAGYHKPKPPPKKTPKTKPKKPAPKLVTESRQTGPRPVYTKRSSRKTTAAPMPEPHIPSGQPISERAMVAKARTASRTRAMKRYYAQQRDAINWAARTSNFVAPGLEAPKHPRVRLAPGEAFALDMRRATFNAEGKRLLATRQERRKL